MVHKAEGRIYVDVISGYDYDETVAALKTVFGISGICPVVYAEDRGFEQLTKDVFKYLDDVYPDKAMLLLSGGIDSPVAGYMIAKRGVKIDAVYFHAPPYTSERAKQKVVDLAKLVSRYAGPVYLHVVNFTDIQLYIYEKCPHEELTIIMRRYMMRIAEHFAGKSGCLGLVTGESIGQVASQTMHSLAVTNEVCTLPVYRPLIGFDKQEIVELSEKINTYETSILPYEDCCTIFVAKHPVTKPNLKVICRHEENLAEKIEELVQTAMETKELMIVQE